MSEFNSFREFYPFYLQEHQNPVNRGLHFFGTSLVILTLVGALLSGRWLLLLLLPIFGYGFAWIGHFAVEKNKPATFKHPFYSLIGDFVMYKDILLGRIPKD